MINRFIKLLTLAIALLIGSTASSQTTWNIVPGWNLMGNNSIGPLPVTYPGLSNPDQTNSIWTWNAATSKWSFYAPSMTSSELSAYAQSKGYDVLSSIASKQGFWISANSAFSVTSPSNNNAALAASDIPLGWSLVGAAGNSTPSQLSQSLRVGLNAEGKDVSAIWTWDTESSTWRFYAPSLEIQGGTALSDYISSKGYRPFTTEISISNGVWLYTAEIEPVLRFTTTWTGNVLEGAIDYCTNRSIRWIAPISGFDVNKDGITDFIMPISCYQGPDPLPYEKHNRQIIAAWKMWCSKPDKSYYDCTQDKFGTAVINATGTNSGGGNPYIHVMEQPFDINNDGYPDFWYALNRDDGRPGFDFNNPDDVKILTILCGPHLPNDWELDCTRQSNQSVLLSQADGSYKVAIIPWGPTGTQAMVMLPNLVGTYDALSFPTWRAARLINNAFVDVTTEYKSYQNIDAVGNGDPYVRVFKSDGVTYLAMPGIPSQYADADIAAKNGTWGFSLWKWTPGVGFTLSDYYKPTADNVFIYNEQSGNTSVKRYGAYIRGVATFTPRWHFFRYTTLDPSEGPILVVSQEAGSTAGKYYKAVVDSNAIYSPYTYDSPNNQYRYVEQSPVEAFYIQNGKIIPRLKSVIAGDVVFNALPIFEDLNGDGYTDAIGVSGHSQRGSVFINDTKGVLHKMYTATSLPSYTNSSSWTIRNFGDSSNLGLLYWGVGFNTLPAWAGTTYIVPDITLVQSMIPIVSLPIHTPELMQSEIQTCLTNMTWIDQCGFE